MKRLIAAILLSTALPAYADGPGLGIDDPEVIAPARASGDWTGPYVGLSYGRSSTSSEGLRCFKIDQPKACNDPVFIYYPEFKRTESFSTEAGASDVGIFAGYRHDFGRVVGGAEVSVLGDQKAAEAQIGIDLGMAFAYGLGGVDDTGAIYGVGVDLKVGKRLILGVKHQSGDLGDVTALRVGIQF